MIDEVEGTDWGDDDKTEAPGRVAMAEKFRDADEEDLFGRHEYGDPAYCPCYIEVAVI